MIKSLWRLSPHVWCLNRYVWWSTWSTPNFWRLSPNYQFHDGCTPMFDCQPGILDGRTHMFDDNHQTTIILWDVLTFLVLSQQPRRWSSRNDIFSISSFGVTGLVRGARRDSTRMIPGLNTSHIFREYLKRIEQHIPVLGLGWFRIEHGPSWNTMIYGAGFIFVSY
jgi:hypothetical protein